jgi:hypothetical protein
LVCGRPARALECLKAPRETTMGRLGTLPDSATSMSQYKYSELAVDLMDASSLGYLAKRSPVWLHVLDCTFLVLAVWVQFCVWARRPGRRNPSAVRVPRAIAIDKEVFFSCSGSTVPTVYASPSSPRL